MISPLSILANNCSKSLFPFSIQKLVGDTDIEDAYEFLNPTYIESVRIVFDSDLDRATVKGGIEEVRDCPTICNRPLNMTSYTFPATMTKSFELIADGTVIYSTKTNYQRFVKIPLNRNVKVLELKPIDTYGEKESHIFSFDFK